MWFAQVDKFFWNLFTKNWPLLLNISKQRTSSIPHYWGKKVHRLEFKNILICKYMLQHGFMPFIRQQVARMSFCTFQLTLVSKPSTFLLIWSNLFISRAYNSNFENITFCTNGSPLSKRLSYFSVILVQMGFQFLTMSNIFSWLLFE